MAAAAAVEPAGECGICYEAFGAGRARRQLPCGHALCLACLRGLARGAATTAAAAFLSCPFCRTVTLVPEEAAEAPGLLRGAWGPGGREAGPGGAWAAEVAPVPVFAVSSLVSPCGLRAEAPGAFVLGLPARGRVLDAQLPLASMENLRLGFAAGILVLIVSTFFLLVFLK